MKLSIVKKGYSSRPWRMVNEHGQEITRYQRFDHPHLGATTIAFPIAGDTKKECMEKALELLADLWEKTKGIAQPCRQCGTTMITIDRT